MDRRMQLQTMIDELSIGSFRRMQLQTMIDELSIGSFHFLQRNFSSEQSR